MATGFITTHIRPLRAHELILVFSDRGETTYNPQKERVRNDGVVKTVRNNGIARHYAKPRKSYFDDGTRHPQDVLYFPSETGLHPTQKPLDLIQWLIKTYSNENEIILDPFAGSGTTAVGAIKTNRKYIAIEKDPEYYSVAKERLEQTVMDENPFSDVYFPKYIQPSLFSTNSSVLMTGMAEDVLE